jgi:hypothetical protein
MDGFIDFEGYRINPATGVILGRRGYAVGHPAGNGHLIVTNGYRKMCRSAHRMVWEAVHGPIPEGLQINHKNGVKTDNRIENLELVTASENTAHAYRLGLICAKGERNGRAIGKRRLAELQREAA